MTDEEIHAMIVQVVIKEVLPTVQKLSENNWDHMYKTLDYIEKKLKAEIRKIIKQEHCTCPNPKTSKHK